MVRKIECIIYPSSVSENQMTYLFAQDLNTVDVARETRQMQRRGPEVVRLLQVDSRVHQQFDEIRMSLVRRPVKSSVAIDIGQVI